MSDLISISMSDFNPLKSKFESTGWVLAVDFFSERQITNEDVQLQINKQKQVPCPISVFLWWDRMHLEAAFLSYELATIDELFNHYDS